MEEKPTGEKAYEGKNLRHLTDEELAEEVKKASQKVELLKNQSIEITRQKSAASSRVEEIMLEQEERLKIKKAKDKASLICTGARVRYTRDRAWYGKESYIIVAVFPGNPIERGIVFLKNDDCPALLPVEARDLLGNDWEIL